MKFDTFNLTVQSLNLDFEQTDQFCNLIVWVLIFKLKN